MSIWHRNKVFSMIKCLSSVAVKVILVRRSLQLKCVSFTPASPLFYDSCICSAIQTILHFTLKRFQFFLTRWTEIFLSLIAGHFYHRLFPVLYFYIVTQRNTKENSTGFTPLSLSAHLWRLIWAFSKAISRFKLGSN